MEGESFMFFPIRRAYQKLAALSPATCASPAWWCSSHLLKPPFPSAYLRHSCLDELHLEGSHLAPCASASKPHTVSADANGEMLLLAGSPRILVYLCHGAAPLRYARILLSTFSVPFGESLSVRLIATIPSPLLCYHSTDGQGTQIALCNPCSTARKMVSLWKSS